MQWTNDGPADLARLTTRLWQAAIVAGRLLLIGVVLLAIWLRWLDTQGQLGAQTRAGFLPIVVALSLFAGIGWPCLLLPISPRRLLGIEDGFVRGETVLGARRVGVDGLRVRSHWFPLSRPTFDGMVFLLQDAQGRGLLLIDDCPEAEDSAEVPDADRSIAADASDRPPLAALMARERQRPISGRERARGWVGLIGQVTISLGLIYVLLTVVFP